VLRASPNFFGWIVDEAFFISSAFFAAKFQLIPVFLPFFAPDKWAAANQTDFCRQMPFFVYWNRIV
jgi:predicted GNAT superfamily acetyltransferase